MYLEFPVITIVMNEHVETLWTQPMWQCVVNCAYYNEPLYLLTFLSNWNRGYCTIHGQISAILACIIRYMKYIEIWILPSNTRAPVCVSRDADVKALRHCGCWTLVAWQSWIVLWLRALCSIMPQASKYHPDAKELWTMIWFDIPGPYCLNTWRRNGASSSSACLLHGLVQKVMNWPPNCQFSRTKRWLGSHLIIGDVQVFAGEHEQ